MFYCTWGFNLNSTYFEKNIFMRIYVHKNAYEITEFRPLSLQPVELCYILLVFLGRMENSCLCSLHIITFFKSNFPPKCLFTLRIIKVAGLNLVVFLLNFSWSRYKDWHEWKTLSIPPDYFVLNSVSGFVHISTTGSLTDGNIELSSGNMGRLINDAEFSRK